MRLEFTTKTMRAARKRSGDVCECHRLAHLNIPGLNPEGCGVTLTARSGIRHEHIICDAIRPDNSLENCAVLTKTCWRIKTDHYDQGTIARVRQRRDRDGGIKKPLRGRPIAGTKASGWKHTMSGHWERR